MRRCASVMALLAVCVAAGLAAGQFDGRSASLAAAAPAGLAVRPADAAGVAVAADGTVTLTAGAAAWSEAPFTRAGALVGPVQALAEPATAVLVGWEAEVPDGAAIRLEVRGWTGERALPWAEVAAGQVAALPAPATAVQYRLTLLALPDAPGPVVRAVTLTPVAGAPPALAAAAVPASVSARVYATRIGLIGRQTANGHIIAPGDRFVALPSRRVLATRGGHEYEVRVEYRGRSVTLPVWDVGPWNVRDNYWDTSVERDMWNDLPPGLPQAAAAYYDVYHGGRDGFGRRVLSPAAIDLSDAAFAELGMTQADWVTVTFLWQAGRR
jgi:hypothetical protein